DGVAAARISAQLRGLSLRAGDELIVADNTPTGSFRGAEPVRVVRAPERRSAYHARNAGAAAATAPWILFTDADCDLPADLLDRAFDPPPDPGCALIAGEVTGVASQTGLLA